MTYMLEKITDTIDKVVIYSDQEEVNCYLIKGKNGVTIIDTGNYSEKGIEIWEKIFDMGIKPEKIVLTHTHQDHIGMAKWLQQTKGIPVIVAKQGYTEMKKYVIPNFVQKFNHMLKRHGFTESVSKSSIPLQDYAFIYDFEPDGFFDKDEKLQLGDDVYEVIWTPGHAPDHFSFYHRDKKMMIIGDHVLKKVAPVIGLWSGEEENVLPDYFHSLETIKSYPTELALPGHGEMIYDLNYQVEEIEKKHHHRLEQALHLITGERKTVVQVCQKIYGSINLAVFIGPFMATLTRLLYLESTGKAKRDEENGVAYFQAI